MMMVLVDAIDEDADEDDDCESDRTSLKSVSQRRASDYLMRCG